MSRKINGRTAEERVAIVHAPSGGGGLGLLGYYPDQAAAEADLAKIAKADPEGVKRGDYGIDVGRDEAEHEEMMGSGRQETEVEPSLERGGTVECAECVGTGRGGDRSILCHECRGDGVVEVEGGAWFFMVYGGGLRKDRDGKLLDRHRLDGFASLDAARSAAMRWLGYAAVQGRIHGAVKVSYGQGAEGKFEATDG